MEEIYRDKAKELIAETILNESNCDLEELKIDFPYYDYTEEISSLISSGKISRLSEQNLIGIETEEWFDIEFTLEFRPIYRLYLIDSLLHVTNQYLEMRLFEFKIEYKVIGAKELTGKCPCCEFYSIDFGEDGAWDICPVCFWENGGSGPNHMTLKEAQQNFNEIGAMSESALKFIDPKGKLKYKKEHSKELN
ncbi:hypothetical protein DCS32_11700 [Dokdonia sp. Dokd-P16]|uniref:CPCC family cysteine-rich protein n=1 Tax=Dokdonia sp. Dokd-P16 TaxID=2173169 RepID=UPI000D548B3D|nr:CPCC family cysteine-rich protein [Dokdonia sp. Dokd-P16]AWH74796.1 hypothetical protein DCS32_11700 [Dokdonia sp. Dokd-P16]